MLKHTTPHPFSQNTTQPNDDVYRSKQLTTRYHHIVSNSTFLPFFVKFALVFPAGTYNVRLGSMSALL